MIAPRAAVVAAGGLQLTKRAEPEPLDQFRRDLTTNPCALYVWLNQGNRPVQAGDKNQ
jgi:hypothetical protein